MPRMQRSARGRWQVFWRSLQMQVARETQTGQLQQMLLVSQKGHQVCTTGMLAGPCLHAAHLYNAGLSFREGCHLATELPVRRGGDNPPPFSFGEMLLLSGR